ncbi:MAG: hypothetical protein AAGL96_03990 [Pseudomonadota bacterium]
MIEWQLGGLPSSRKGRNFLLRVIVNANHNTICFFQDFQPGDGDPLQVASAKRPNAFEAERRFRTEWANKSLNQYGVDELVVTIFLDHCGGVFTNKNQKLAITKLGYSAAIVMFQTDLMEGAEERPCLDILSYLDMSMSEILGRPALVRSKKL